ncbi:hypothetical protein GCM10025857_11530 [Alicyclobacillus contaminans]|nr:hypothetical protein GCM10025857_11530 [Alicyclobacillus contaminans]
MRHYYRFGPVEREASSDVPARTTVADVSGVVVGVASVWRDSMHPNRLRCGVMVHPAYRHKGLGRQLAACLEELNPEALPLSTSLWAHKAEGRTARFLHALGFHQVQAKYIGQLSVRDVDVEAFRPLMEWVKEAGYTVHSLADYLERSADRLALAELFREVYTASHRHDPPADMALVDWLALLQENAVPDGSLVVQCNGVPVAVALLHNGIQQSMELGWRGVAAAHAPAKRQLLLAVTLAQISYAAANGARRVTLEAASTDAGSMTVLDELPFAATPGWLTFHNDPA